MKYLIAGGKGFIGQALSRSLLQDGHQVWVLTRAIASPSQPAGLKILTWDGVTSQGWLDAFNEMDAVVNLAGATIGQWPWNSRRKQEILTSRLHAGAAFVEAYRLSNHKPPVYLQASGIGYYGPRGAAPVTEKDSAGNDFIADLAKKWEASSADLDVLPGVRRVMLRTSLVLDAHQGILPQMALPVKLYAGGPLGNGRQGVSWIHSQDEISAIRFLLDRPDALGAFNLAAPNPLSNADFMRALAKKLGKPFWLPAPAFMLRLLLGEMSTLLLDGQFALPERLESLGFKFKFPTLPAGLDEIYG